MANPQFTKTGVTSVVFSRGDAFPRALTGIEGQLIGESEAGTVRVITTHDPIEFFTLNFTGQTRLPTADYNAMRTFLLNALVNLRANTFTWNDTDATARTVRYWEGLYSFTLSSSGFYQGTLVLRKEL